MYIYGSNCFYLLRVFRLIVSKNNQVLHEHFFNNSISIIPQMSNPLQTSANLLVAFYT